jgi:hypothetical protein
VQGFNNFVAGGAPVWGSPTRAVRPEDEMILKGNLERCADAINRRRGLRGSTTEPQNFAATIRSARLPKSIRKLLAVSVQMQPPAFATAQATRRRIPFGGTYSQSPHGFSYGLRNPKSSTFRPQPSSPPAPPRFAPPALPSGSEGTSAASEHWLKEDISRLETQVAKLFELVGEKKETKV